jgi:hypothetical protein
MRIFLVTTMMVGLTVLAVGCGKEISEEEREALRDPQIYDPENRAKYCFVGIESESEDMKRSLLEEVKGTWTFYPDKSDGGLRRQEFRLDLENRIAAVSQYYQGSKDVEDITFRRLCLSKPLGTSFGAYAEYRVLEFMAANNEGGAALLVGLEPATNGASSVMRLSDRYYRRNASNSAVVTPSWLLQNQPLHSIWTYREHRY